MKDDEESSTPKEQMLHFVLHDHIPSVTLSLRLESRNTGRPAG